MKKAYFFAAAFFAFGITDTQAQFKTDLQELYVVQSTIAVCKLKVAKSTAQNIQSAVDEMEKRLSANSREKWQGIVKSSEVNMAKQKAMYCEPNGHFLDVIYRVINSFK